MHEYFPYGLLQFVDDLKDTWVRGKDITGKDLGFEKNIKAKNEAK